MFFFFFTENEVKIPRNSLDVLKDHELAINWKLFKRCRYYHIMFESNPLAIMKWNGYQISFMIAIVTFVGLILFGNMGFFMNLDITFTNIEYIMIFYCFIHAYLMLYKLFVLIYFSKKFWYILNVSQIKFLKSIPCIKNRKILNTHRDETTKLTNIYCILSIYAIVQWMIFPFVVEIFYPSNIETKRIQNVVNIPFPFTIFYYNKYYIIFYVIESVLSGFLMYGLFMIDLFLLSFGWVIVAQYRVIIHAFSDIGYTYNFGMYMTVRMVVILLVLIMTHYKNKKKN